jgi:hypothetical protein
MILNNINSVLKLVAAQATTIHVSVDYADYSSNTTAPTLLGINTQKTTITTASDTIILPAPAAGNVSRQVLKINIANLTNSSNSIIINIYESAVILRQYDCSIGGGESINYAKDYGWKRLNKSGVEYNAILETNIPIKTHQFLLSKLSVGTSEGAGQFHALFTSSGLLPPWAVGTSGLGGRPVQKTENGVLKLPTTGNKLVLTENNLVNSAAGTPIHLVDILFVNNGLVVTTLTAQTVGTVALPARDIDRAINGVGCMWGLLVTSATTNAAAINNITASYINQNGAINNIATMSNFPATAAVGTFVPFILASPDTGARSIQSVTLGTSLTAGAVSLVCLRIVDTVQTSAANLVSFYPSKQTLLYGDEALSVMLMGVGATAYAINPSSILINEYL